MKLYIYCYLLLLLSLIACGQQPDKNKKSAGKQPQHYNLNKPQVFKMSGKLNEISGIAFNKGDASTVYAEQDEDGKLFYFRLGNNDITETKFGRKGDYEDVQICSKYVVMLRSDGVLFTFPLSETNNREAKKVKEYKGLLPNGEYEGMYADDATQKLYVLCKHCNEKLSVTNSGYILSAGDNGSITYAGNFTVDVKKIIAKVNDKKINFEPSALAKNNNSNEWYILSSINKLLVVTNNEWKVKEVYPLDASLFNQPEGIAFDNAGNMYISNEKGSAGSATILKIIYEK